jgi:hypothetical protein
VERGGFDELHAAFLNAGCTRGLSSGAQQESRILGFFGEGWDTTVPVL